MLPLFLFAVKYFFAKELKHADCLLVVDRFILVEDYLHNFKEHYNFDCFASDSDYINR
jgi:hypothetical protein